MLRKTIGKILHIIPRALTVVLVIFFYLFALEGFSPEFGWGDSLSHFIVATMFLGIGIMAWKKPLIGGWFFILPFAAILVQGKLNPFFGGIAAVGLLYLVDGYFSAKGTKGI